MQNDIKDLLTPETIGVLLTVITMWLTKVFKVNFDTEGNTTRLVNAVVNFARGAIVMILNGEASWSYAVLWAVFGFMVDQATYFTLVKPEKKTKTS
jgi:Fe2+ transport system protein B